MSQIIETELRRQSRPTWAEIDLSNLAFNLSQIKKRLSPEIKIMPIVKADAYGHGIVEVSQYLAAQGIDYLGVATVDEGIYLRKAGITISLLVLGTILPEEAEALLEYNLIPTICNRDTAVILNRLASQRNIPVKIHIKIDTGMGRIGVWHEEVLDFFSKIKELGQLEFEGIWTHFASAEDMEFTNLQLGRFNFILRGLEQLGYKFAYIHAANSTAILKNTSSHFNMVRPGLALYGVYPDISVRQTIELKPVMQLKTRIIFLKKVSAGQSISYGRTFVTSRESLIATLPIGYGDGYAWSLSNRAMVIVEGRRVPIVGRVCMDQIMIDVTDVGDVKLGEEVVLIGQQDNERISVEELASLSGTIPYEILCRIASRIPRIYKASGLSILSEVRRK
jgi:alanine racemase